MRLATKYRPKTFGEVIGQQIATTILKYQIQNKEIGNGYLFCGNSGCGKTTIARIFANELNEGQSTPIEIDASSNNSVDMIRNLIKTANNISIKDNYQVIILDEVHMLSNSASNALLKVLEEPIPQTVFVLCTTNPEKLLPTILSRVQTIRFSKVAEDLIKVRLVEILKQENKIVTDNVLNLIVNNCYGSVRSAITLLEQVIALDNNLDNIKSLLDSPDVGDIIKIMDFICKDKYSDEQKINQFRIFLNENEKYFSYTSIAGCIMKVSLDIVLMSKQQNTDTPSTTFIKTCADKDLIDRLIRATRDSNPSKQYYCNMALKFTSSMRECLISLDKSRIPQYLLLSYVMSILFDNRRN